MRGRLAVFGAGAWGTTIAKVVASNIHDVVLIARDDSVIEAINGRRVNEKFLPGIVLPKNVRACQVRDIESPFDLAVWAIPVQFMRERLAEYRRVISETGSIINLSKGLERRTACRPSQILREFFPVATAIASLGGPNIASDVASAKPAFATIAVENFWKSDQLSDLFKGTSIAVDVVTDVIAVELAGALKNVVAIAAGVTDGLGEGINFKAALVSKGFKEIQSISRALGANPEALVSPFGVGDLVATCFSSESRNRRFGEALGRGQSLEQSINSLDGRIAEGFETALTCCSVIEHLRLHCPILSFVSRLVSGGAVPSDILELK